VLHGSNLLQACWSTSAHRAFKFFVTFLFLFFFLSNSHNNNNNNAWIFFSWVL
jgi:hypothetical protein